MVIIFQRKRLLKMINENEIKAELSNIDDEIRKKIQATEEKDKLSFLEQDAS